MISMMEREGNHTMDGLFNGPISIREHGMKKMKSVMNSEHWFYDPEFLENQK